MPIAQGKGRGRGGARSGPHTELVKACLQWLELHKIPAWKMNTGANVIPATARTKERFVRYAFPGCSDIIGIIPRDGRFLAVECKTGRGELSEDQVVFAKMVEQAGGLYVVARSVDDLVQVHVGFFGKG